MLAKDLITDEIPPLKLTDTGTKALQWMDEFKVSHLPIIDKNEFLGLVSDTDILDKNISDEPIGKYKMSLLRPFIFERQHIFEAIKLISKINITVIPVVDKDQHYLGLITMNDLMRQIAQLAAIQEPGGIIVLELNTNDYALSQIAQIVEGNDAKILSCYYTMLPDSTKIEVTLKINKEDLSGILQTFNRYNYNVKASFHQSEFVNDLNSRYNYFINYLGV